MSEPDEMNDADGDETDETEDVAVGYYEDGFLRKATWRPGAGIELPSVTFVYSPYTSPEVATLQERLRREHNAEKIAQITRREMGRRIKHWDLKKSRTETVNLKDERQMTRVDAVIIEGVFAMMLDSAGAAESQLKN